MTTQYWEPGIIFDSIRFIFALLDGVAYNLLGVMYELFFNVAGAELFETATIKNFYSRVQLIIGVFMLFKLAVSILKGIMNPDKFTDQKQGFSSVITRVIISLALLTVIVPINIPDAEHGSFNARLNNDGLLFGTLYSLQDRVLSNNTLGRLILGTSDNLTPSDEEKEEGITAADKQAETLKKSANTFSTTILRGFFRVNLVEGETDETIANNRLCPDEKSGKLIKEIYAAEDASPTQILTLVNKNCETAGFLERVGNAVSNAFKNVSNFVIGTDFETEQSSFYVFSYFPVVSTIVAVIFIVVLLGFTIDIAIRAIKLSILRLIAPIPIISYIDPKSAEKGAFASWVKALTSTYLDVFLRLAIVYFVIFLIQDMMQNGIFINTGTGFIGILTCILIWIGLFIFAKQAPKFIKDVLGIKGLGMSNIGLSGILGGTAMLAGGGGAKGFALGTMQGMTGEQEAAAQGKAYSPMQSWSNNRDLMRKIATGDKDAKGGIIGKTMDRLNYDVRENNAEKLGYGKTNKAKADWNKKQLQGLAGAAADEYDDAKMDLDTYLQTADKSEPMYGAVLQQKMQAVKEARAKKAKADINFQKANGAADKIDKYRAQLGTAPRISDIPKFTYRSEQRINDDNATGYNMDSNGQFDPNSVVNYVTPGNEAFDPFKGSTHAGTSGVGSNPTVDDSTLGSRGHGPDE